MVLNAYGNNGLKKAARRIQLCSLRMQGLDKGVLFSTYNLLISQSTKFSSVKTMQVSDPLKFSNPELAGADIHVKKEYVEAVCGEMEFGGGPTPIFMSLQLLSRACCFMSFVARDYFKRH